MVTGLISRRSALIFGSLLAFVGFGLLALGTNLLTMLLAFVGFGFYVVLYGAAKRRSVYGTLVGSVSGAIPVVVGYCAVTGRFDLGATLLFVILVLWQMPHFYAIAIYRLDDYASAKIPVLPITSGIRSTKVQILWYIAAFMVATASLSVLGYTGYIYLAVMTLVGLGWLRLAVQGFRATNDRLWARGLFRFSLIVIIAFSIMISINAMLPMIVFSG